MHLSNKLTICSRHLTLSSHTLWQNPNQLSLIINNRVHEKEYINDLLVMARDTHHPPIEIHTYTILSRYAWDTHHPPIEIHIYSILSRYASPSYRDTHIQYSIEVRITLLSRYTYTVSYRGTHHPPIEIYIYTIHIYTLLMQ
jgi:hypothetical protein